MIVGNGLIANAFNEYYSDCEDIVIVASGVSNSLEKDPTEFRREQDLLKEVLQNYATSLVVYFGTCSVYDSSVTETPYVQHKLKMEKLVSETASNYLIFRLPHVVGNEGNRATIVNFLFENIIHGNFFELWVNAIRYIVDIEDVVRFVTYVIGNTPQYNCTINLVSVPCRVEEVMRCLEKLIGKSAIYQVVDKGTVYSIPLTVPTLTIEEAGIVFGDCYLEKVLTKYFLPRGINS